MPACQATATHSVLPDTSLVLVLCQQSEQHVRVFLHALQHAESVHTTKTQWQLCDEAVIYCSCSTDSWRKAACDVHIPAKPIPSLTTHQSHMAMQFSLSDCQIAASTQLHLLAAALLCHAEHQVAHRPVICIPRHLESIALCCRYAQP